MNSCLKRTALIVIACSAMLISAALPRAQAQSVLHIGIQDDPDTFDPARAYSFVGRIVLTSLCDKLVDTAPDLSFVPQLALSWETASDGKSVTFKLRPGVKFSDGTDMDAAAVAFNIERDLTLPTSRRRSEISAVDKVEVVDPLTVRFRLKTPFAPLIAQLSDRAGMIASPKALQNPAGFDATPACSGPFKSLERVAQDRIVLVRNPLYWDRGRFHFDRVEYRVITDPTIRLLNLRTGSLDLAERILASDVAAIKSDPSLTVMVGPSLQYNGITFNFANGTGMSPEFSKSPQLREALNLSIDRDAINQVIFDGNAVPSNQPVAPGTRFYAADRPVPQRDVARAKALVAASGIAHPSLTMNLQNNAAQTQLGEMIQAMAREAGIEVTLRAMEFQTQLQAQSSGNFQASLVGWSGRVDPDGNTYTLLGCTSPTNDGRWCAAAEPYLLAGRDEVDPAKRVTDYHSALRIIVDDDPIIYLYHPPQIVAMTSKLKGFTYHPDGLMRLRDVSMAP